MRLGMHLKIIFHHFSCEERSVLTTELARTLSGRDDSTPTVDPTDNSILVECNPETFQFESCKRKD